MCKIVSGRTTDKVSQTIPFNHTALYLSFHIERLLYAALYKQLHGMESRDREWLDATRFWSTIVQQSRQY